MSNIFAASLPPVGSLSDSIATQYGLKTYYTGTTYNGGIDPSLGNSATTNIRSWFQPFQDTDGNWYMKFSIYTNTTAATAGNITINGVTMNQTPGYQQAITGAVQSGAAVDYAYADQGTNTVAWNLSNFEGVILLSGIIALDSKPTWAY